MNEQLLQFEEKTIFVSFIKFIFLCASSSASDEYGKHPKSGKKGFEIAILSLILCLLLFFFYV